jgi:glycosyltransferase involved in cell wall biosynthesis
LKLLFLVNNDWYFWSHRLPIGRAALAAGAEVYIMSKVSSYGDRLAQEGFTVIDWKLTQRSLNPWKELKAFMQVWRVYRTLKPDLVHHVALKSVVYGGFVSRLAGNIPCVNAVAGLGHVFTTTTWRTRLLRPFLRVLFWFALGGKNSLAIFQNADNLQSMLDLHAISRAKAVIVRGSGADLRTFVPVPEPEGVPLVVLVTRILRDKGVEEFVDAARDIRDHHVPARFALVGDTDPGNPTAISKEQILRWVEEGVVEWWGHRSDVHRVFAESSIVCLPSYAEGLPKVLVEAAAAGRAIVTTDVCGCREVVQPGVNGLLVPARQSQPLAKALRILIEDPARRRAMGQKGRELIEREFAQEIVVRQTLAVYDRILRPRGITLFAPPEK